MQAHGNPKMKEFIPNVIINRNPADISDQSWRPNLTSHTTSHTISSFATLHHVLTASYDHDHRLRSQSWRTKTSYDYRHSSSHRIRTRPSASNHAPGSRAEPCCANPTLYFCTQYSSAESCELSVTFLLQASIWSSIFFSHMLQGRKGLGGRGNERNLDLSCSEVGVL